MDVHAELRADAAPSAVFSWIDDLVRYPQWMPLVHGATRLADDGDTGLPTWQVELRGRVGPFTRSKRLRMARTAHEIDRHVRFERAEVDGRSHSPWVLDARIEQVADATPQQPAETLLTIHLHYGGTLWTGGVLERALADDIRRGREQLAALLSASPTR